MWMLLVLSAAVGVLGSEDSPSGAAVELQALHCPPCEQVHCPTRRTLKLQCKGGITTGVCGCCPVCARTDGETCGGTWDYLGTCDEGLVCVYQDAAADNPTSERRGVCRTGGQHDRAPGSGELLPRMHQGLLSGQPLGNLLSQVTESTHPPYVFVLCFNQASECVLCRFVSLDKRACQGSCQHTSCSSCLLLRPPACPQTCNPSDQSCLQRFGKCVHSRLLATHNPVCNQNLQNHPEGHLLCFVPACPPPPL
ncbi:uncharacterized protein ACBR49_003335 [Aulostomus maculatus]